jgi:putative DNA primase/helicase
MENSNQSKGVALTMQYTIDGLDPQHHVLFDNIPSQLKMYRQFVLWKSEPRDDKLTKIPYNANLSGNASTTDPATWSNFVTAKGRYISHHRSQQFAGIGFVFSDDDPFTGIDIDDCLDENKNPLKWVQPILDLLMPTYAEISPSGTGLKLWVEGKKSPHWGSRCRKGNIEVYDKLRFFTMTGDVLDSSTHIQDRSADLDTLYKMWFDTPQEKEEAKDDLQQRQTQVFTTTPDEKQNDNDILQRAINKDPKFKDLYVDGNISLYDSSSEADAALCCKLAFWFQHKTEKIDQYFRSSALMRDKWNRDSYRNTTIQFAIDNTESRDPLHQAKILIVPKTANAPKSHDTQPQDVMHTNNSNDNNGNNDNNGAKAEIDVSTNTLPKTEAFYRDTLLTLGADNNLLWCETLGKWLIWDSKQWKFDDTKQIFNLTDQLIPHFLHLSATATDNDQRTLYWDLAKGCSSHSKQKNIAEMVKPKTPVTVNQLDQHHTLLNALNGTINLTTGDITPHNPKNLITKLVNANLPHPDTQPQPSTTRWLTFLHEIMDGNTELIEFLQRAIGYSLFGLTTEHYLFVLHGHGRNGKSTFIDVITEILGDYAMPSAPDLLMNRGNNESHPTEIAELRGMRLVCCSETEQNHRLKESLVKRLTGGDTLKGRYMHQNFFSFKPSHTLFMATNRTPEVHGTDTGIWSRLRLIPFDVSFEGREDTSLKQKLLAEADHILHWATQGAVQWYNHGLTFPDEVINASSQWRHDADILGRFIEDQCAVAELFEEKSSEIYKAYKAFCEEAGERYDSANKFALKMTEKGFQKKKRKNGAFWLGIKMVTAQGDEAGFRDENGVISFKKSD